MHAINVKEVANPVFKVKEFNELILGLAYLPHVLSLQGEG